MDPRRQWVRISFTHCLEGNRNNERVDRLHIRKNGEDGVTDESSRSGCNTRLIDHHDI